MPSKVWDKIISPFPNFKGCACNDYFSRPMALTLWTEHDSETSLHYIKFRNDWATWKLIMSKSKMSFGGIIYFSILLRLQCTTQWQTLYHVVLNNVRSLDWSPPIGQRLAGSLWCQFYCKLVSGRILKDVLLKVCLGNGLQVRNDLYDIMCVDIFYGTKHSKANDLATGYLKNTRVASYMYIYQCTI